MSRDIISNNSNPIAIYEPEQYYRFNRLTTNWVATNGVMNFCCTNNCNWVLDVIASYVFSLNRSKNIDYLLVIEIKVDANSKAIFTISQQPGEEREILFKQHIKYTDLNKDLTFWAINETNNNQSEVSTLSRCAISRYPAHYKLAFASSDLLYPLIHQCISQHIFSHY